MNRTENLENLDQATFDVVVIGGGASGAGAALDACLRGLKVLLVEKEDFAAETSSKSTKLIHGGVRYLEQAFLKLQFGQLRQVQHGLEERHLLLHNAPHLARPLGLITPVFSWFAGLYYTFGLKLYGLFASKKDTLPKAKWLSKKEAKQRINNLTSRAHSAILYYDGQFDDARFCLGLAQASSEAGATVLNHIAVTDFIKNEAGKLSAVLLTDEFSEKTCTVNAKAFLNCTGAGADIIRQKANPDLAKRILPSKGVHLVLPLESLGSQADALLIPETPDGRVVFAIPFHGKLMLGTTDEPYKTPEKEPTLSDAEIDYLLETLAPYVDKVPSKSQVSAGFGGLRPLILADPSASSKSLLRDHAVELDKVSGLFSLLGGKWTTYRIMARDAVDEVAEALGNTATCTTAEHFLPGGASFSEKIAENLQSKYHLDADIAEHLMRAYGDRADKVAAFCEIFPTDKNRLVPNFPYINAEVRYAARYEMACTPRDVLARRMRLEILDWNACKKATRQVVGILAHELDKDEQWEQSMVTQYQQQIENWQQLV